MTQASSPLALANITDLYRILDEQPQWAEAIRSRLLSAELLAMPQQLAQLTTEVQRLSAVVSQLAETSAEHTRQLAEQSRQLEEQSRQLAEHTRQLEELTIQVKEHTRQLEELTIQVKEHTRQLEELTIQVKAHTRQLEELTIQVKAHTRQLEEQTIQIKEQSAQIIGLHRTDEIHQARMDRMERDMSDIKGMLAEYRPERTSLRIAALLGLAGPTLVPAAALEQFAVWHNLDRQTRSSFVNADLVFTAQDEAGQPVYCAVEISWTVNQRDLDRASRNAALIRAASGQPTYAVAVGNRYEKDLAWKEVNWTPLND